VAWYPKYTSLPFTDGRAIHKGLTLVHF